jgi:2-succinyl-5-enolpyruvyl-6-hydroxy-3-cyclohexene-1-carboxylate synthase
VPRDPLLNLRHAARLVDALARAGVHHVVVAPGGRSAPLAVAVAQHPRLRDWVVTDERSAAFFALGMARELGEAVALVCTSGTAVANLMPGVVEADLSEVPLVVVTADRPPELRDVGAAQTIRQVGLFDGHVRWSVDLPPPAADADLERAWTRTACRAVATARAARPGPVHVNVPFREPLVPAGALPRLGFPDAEEPPPLAYVGATATVAEADARMIADAAAARERGIIVCGARAGVRDAAALASLARALAWPILADPLSGVRFGLDPEVQADGYDLVLRDPAWRRRLAPSAVLHFGGLPVSKALQATLAEAQPSVHVVAASPGVWPDPSHLSTVMVHAPADTLVRAVADVLARPRRAGTWRADWVGASRRVRAAVGAKLAAETRVFEAKVVTDTLAALPDGGALHVGNSMPVRDLDTFAGADGPRRRIVCNRGANGIDGVLSSALGAAAVSGGPVALVVGDLSFLHDAGGLQLAARHGIDATVVVVSNDGGGVFSFLPEAGYGEVFERCFGTPHGLDVGRIAGACGAAVRRVDGGKDVEAAVTRALATPGLAVVEVPSSRDANAALHREYVAAAAAALCEGDDGRISA